MRRFVPVVAIALSLALVAASAAPVGHASALSIGQPVMRDCAGELLSTRTAGVDGRSYRAPAAGLLTARLEGDAKPDWDLVLYRGLDPVASSTSFGSIEQASTMVRAGEAVWIQACRRDGRRSEIPLRLRLYEVSPDPDPERISMESVPISGLGDVERLERLGLDVTHDVSPTAATVVLYSDAQRALLDAAGFDSVTIVGNLALADAIERRDDARAAAGTRSSLPSGRDTYRVYEDYTSELRTLAHTDPALVRPVTLGNTFEGRPIEGVEIAEGVLRRDDGRPVYLNFGAHHAREWPSAEWPMEFAHTLVQGYKANDPRIRALLEDVRVVIVPVVNADGFIASRSFGTSPLDDDSGATLGQAVANQGAYIRKNCRPTGPGDAAVPCAFRTGSGVDLNRNYGYYWGGPGSGTGTTAQNYRGTAPFSEPESQAVHQYTSTIHPTVFITNHTFTTDGKWLRQPGFDAAFLPQDAIGAYSPADEGAMKDLGDDMAAATGFTSERGYETLGDITGATEDWNYFSQGTYGYTPEARGTNFHMNYATGVVTEYLGDATHPGLGVREAYVVAGERAGNTADHGIIQGTAPPGATLKLIKDFEAPTFNQPALNVDEHLETTLRVSAAGTYEWHVNPSDRPAVIDATHPDPDPGDEQWTMTCQRPGSPTVFTDNTIEVARSQTVTKDWAAACGADTGPAAPVADFAPTPAAPLVGQQVNFFDTSTDPDGAIAITEWDLDNDGQFDDATGLVASRIFDTAGAYDVSVRVTDDEGITDTETKTVVVSNPPPAQPTAPPASVSGTAPAPCHGGTPTIVGTSGDDVLRGTSGDDLIAALAGDDRVVGLGGDDTVCGSVGDDQVSGGSGGDTLMGNKDDDRLRGGPGGDQLGGGQGNDLVAGGAGRDRCSAGAGGGTLRRCP
jgi:PKD repeat protein/murein tripeptide amidase MpaA